MKRAICIILVIFSLCSCKATKEQKTINKNEKILGVWISYSELYSLIDTGDFKKSFDEVVENLKDMNITDAFVHIRPFFDSFYNSDYFPPNEKIKDLDFDIVEYMISSLHNANVKFHAWINPYRVKTAESDITTLNTESPAYKWLTDNVAENDVNVCVCDGIYLNPASSEVNRLIIDGIREILSKYDVDGIHFDDYFYPTSSENFDKASYEIYKSSCESPLPLMAYRRANVNSLISGVYTAVKFEDKNTVFSVSPSASIEKNYSELCADIKLWCDNSCVDMIIPQLYFGFEYPDKDYCFDNLLEEWKNMLKESNVSLVIGLASYKLGTDSESDIIEWQNGDKVLEKQTKICSNDKSISGMVYFSYSSLFSKEELNNKARQKIKAVIK